MSKPSTQVVDKNTLLSELMDVITTVAESQTPGIIPNAESSIRDMLGTNSQQDRKLMANKPLSSNDELDAVARKKLADRRYNEMMYYITNDSPQDRMLMANKPRSTINGKNDISQLQKFANSFK